MNNLPDSVKRGLRSFFQAAVAMIVLQAGALMGDAEDGVIDANLWQRVGLTALVAGAIAFTSWLQNFLEDTTGKTALK